MSYQLRPLIEADQAFILELYQDPAIMHHIGAILTDQQVAGMFKTMMAEVAENKAIYQVILSGEAKHRAGMLSMHWHPETHSIESGMIVAPGFQNKGVCKWAQMRAMESIGSYFPARICTVYISAANLAAITSYQNMGFRTVKNTSNLKKHQNLNRLDFNLETLKQ